LGGLELLHHLWGQVVSVDVDAGSLSTGLGDGLQRTTLKVCGSLYGIDKVADQVSAALVLGLYFRPSFFDVLFAVNKAVVTAATGNKEDGEDANYDGKGTE